MALDDIDAEVAEAWRAKLVRQGLSAATVNKLRWKCEAIFKRAQRVWPVTHNPFANLERQPHRPSGDFNILAPAELAALIRHAEGDQDTAIFAVASFAGLRLGEIRGLQWADLDFADSSSTFVAPTFAAPSRCRSRAGCGRCRWSTS